MNLSDKLGISIASYVGQYGVIEKCINSCLDLESGYVGLSIENKDVCLGNSSNGYLNLFGKVDSVLFIKNLISAKGGHWIGQHLSNISLMKIFNSNIKYLLLINGDCVIGDPIGFYGVLEEFILRDSDILPTAMFKRKAKCFGTMGVIGKIDSVIKLFKLMKTLIEIDTFVRSGNEQRMEIACRKLRFNVFDVENSSDLSFCFPGEGTWAGRMKFSHLHNEWSERKYGSDGWWRNDKSS